MNINLEILVRLLLASLLGGVIGLERESNNRPAGFRTHTLVTIGSTLMMLVSLEVGKQGADPARIASNVVSGIGFLGAGTILRTGSNIEGLTTAASLWVCAGIGLAIGSGYYLGGVLTTLIILFFLRNAKNFERLIPKSAFKVFKIIGRTRPGLIGDIGTVFGKEHIIIKDIAIISVEGEDFVEELHFTVKMPHKLNLDQTLEKLSAIDNLIKIMIDDIEINIGAKI